ncbi:MAG: uracil-DNA glycosylase [Lentisphaerota bacterium]
MDPIGDIIKQVQDHVEYLRDEGMKDLEVDAQTAEMIRSSKPGAQPMPQRPTPIPAPRPVAAKPAAPPPPAATVPVKTETTPALQDVARRVAACTLCPLHKTRTNTVPGQGHPHPEIMFIGEGPGADEDAQGLAFVGRAGQLLTKIIEAMGLTRGQVFIGNIVKCRPPDNRVPLPEEMQACLPYLHEQIALLKPKIIVALGATAVKGLFQSPIGITKLRGQWMSYQGIDCMPTFHPAYLLRNPPEKKWVWEDMKSVLARLGREPPPRAQ